MRFLTALFMLVCSVFMLTRTADAAVSISIDLTTQRMHVNSNSGSYTWAVSTARSGFVTPRGSYRPYMLKKMHYSRKYHNSPMPHSIFFSGGYAIHATSAVGALGRPASHGCIRLAPGNAATLYKMVQAEGARITISGTSPAVYAKVKSHNRSYAKLKAKNNYAARQAAPTRNPLAFAPLRGTSSIKSWQMNPVGN